MLDSESIYSTSVGREHGARNGCFGLFFYPGVYSRAGNGSMHKIRLKRPWQRIAGPEREVLKVDVPDLEPVLASFISQGDVVVYQRNFNSPTGLTVANTVQLKISEWSGILQTVHVNEVSFSSPVAPWEIDISKFLQGHNRIEVKLVSATGEVPCLTGDVVLMIQENGE